jgi:hypothetical protein
MPKMLGWLLFDSYTWNTSFRCLRAPKFSFSHLYLKLKSILVLRYGAGLHMQFMFWQLQQ